MFPICRDFRCLFRERPLLVLRERRVGGLHRALGRGVAGGRLRRLVLRRPGRGIGELLLEGCELRRLAPGDVLLALGQANNVMYMILSGELSVHLEGPLSEAVAKLGPGETVGELSVIDQSPASAYVVAAEPTRLLAVDEPRFWNLVNASHDFAVNLLFSLARACARTTRRSRPTSSCSASTSATR